MSDFETERRELYWALQTRLLTDEEMLQVKMYGDRLNIEPMVSYYAHEKKTELQNALFNQAKIRLLALGKPIPE